MSCTLGISLGISFGFLNILNGSLVLGISFLEFLNILKHIKHDVMFSHLLVTCFNLGNPRVSPPESSETGVDQRPCAKFTAFNLGMANSAGISPIRDPQGSPTKG